MRYLSVCSGIEAATVAWHGLGWKPVAFSEIEPFPCQLLAERFPTVPNLGDMTRYREWPIERGTVDLLVGGTPCQAFSVAGLRKGLEDPRGNLALTFVGMVDWYRPEWVVWENVPGVLSSNGGRDFGAFLGALGQLGYGFAYRVLDAQYFGVPQRRRRVFVVAHSSGDSRRAGAVLFEPESLRGDTPTRKRTGQDAPAHAGASPEAGDGSVLYENHANDSRVTQEDSTCPTVTSRWGTGGNNTPLVQQAYRKSRRAQSSDDFETWVDDGVANTVNCFDQGDIRTTHAVAVQQAIPIQDCREMSKGQNGLGVGNPGDPSYTLDRMATQAVAVQQPMAFQQNMREEVRLINANGQIAGALAARPGVHQQNYIALPQPMAFSPQGGGDMSGVVPKPTAQLQRCQVEGVIQPVAFAQNQLGEVRTNDAVVNTLNTNTNASGRNTPMVLQQPIGLDEETNARVDGFGCLKARTEGGGFEGSVMTQEMAVRRLTPVECERLQGFPDGWTDIRPKGKDTPDSPRYKALGNSMAVPVMRWIGERIQREESASTPANLPPV